jgi:hypothetical protein
VCKAVTRVFVKAGVCKTCVYKLVTRVFVKPAQMYVSVVCKAVTDIGWEGRPLRDTFVGLMDVQSCYNVYV